MVIIEVLAPAGGGLGIMGLCSGAPGMNEYISIHMVACVCLSLVLALSLALSNSFLKGGF